VREGLSLLLPLPLEGEDIGGRESLPSPPPSLGRGRTKVGEGLSLLLPLPLGGGGLRWGREKKIATFYPQQILIISFYFFILVLK